MSVWQAEGTVAVDGQALEYGCWGPDPGACAGAPPLVLLLLHEGLGCLALWRDFPERLAAATGLPVLAYSRAGYGQSDPVPLPRPLDYMTREARDVLPALIDAFALRRCLLVGHSDGASIAALYPSCRHDPRVRGLVLMAPHFFTEAAGLAEIARARQAFNDGDLRARLARYHRDPDNAFRGWNDAWLDPGFAAWDIGDALDHLRLPVLAVQGNEDQYGSFAQLEALAARSPGPVEQLRLANCRHSPHLEQPARLLAAIAAFVTRLEAHEAAVAAR